MLNFTRQEQQVILFLVIVALAGMGINFLIKVNSKVVTLAVISQEIGKIDINRADKELLISVSGIGPKLAQRIIEYRNKQGGFGELGELKNIKGISEYKYEKIKDCLFIK